MNVPSFVDGRCQEEQRGNIPVGGEWIKATLAYIPKDAWSLKTLRTNYLQVATMYRDTQIMLKEREEKKKAAEKTENSSAAIKSTEEVANSEEE